jgi:hypothetical protein
MTGSKTGSFTPPLPRALSNTLLKMGMRDGGSRSPTVSKPLKRQYRTIFSTYFVVYPE